MLQATEAGRFWLLLSCCRAQISCTNIQSLVQAWVEEMAAHMKTLDPNHLVTLGEEGFYSLYKDGVIVNPGMNGASSCTCCQATSRGNLIARWLF